MSWALLALVGFPVLAVVAVVVIVKTVPQRWARVLLIIGATALGALPIALIALFVIVASEPESHPPDPTDAVGVRVDDGALVIWPGAHCDEITDLDVAFSPSDDPVAHTLRLEADGGGFNGPFSLDDLPADVEVEQALPDDFDLDDHRSVVVRGPRMVTVSLEPARTWSQQHPGEFWFGESFGWLSASQASARDGDDLNGACTPRD